MIDTPKLAIIIPFFNIHFFERTLKSLSNQENKNFNIYIGNDCSLDDPKELIDTYKDQLNLRYIEFSDNLGGISLVKQWNRCIELTNEEEWIMILGDDDVLSEDVVLAFYHNLVEIESRETSVIRFSSQLIDADDTAISDVYHHPKLEKATDAYYRTYLNISRSSLSEYIFKKDAYNNYGFKEYPLGWFADNMAWLQYSENRDIFSINEAVVLVRSSAYSITGKSDNISQKYLAAYMFFGDVLAFKENKITLAQRKSYIGELQQLIFKINRLSLANLMKITTYWIGVSEFKNALKFIRFFIKAKMKDG